MGILPIWKVTGHYIQLHLELLLSDILLVQPTDELEIFLIVLLCSLHRYLFQFRVHFVARLLKVSLIAVVMRSNTS